MAELIIAYSPSLTDFVEMETIDLFCGATLSFYNQLKFALSRSPEDSLKASCVSYTQMPGFQKIKYRKLEDKYIFFLPFIIFQYK